ncbi:hypothetical protein [Kocuria kalidii]|uniref:hypothetical protein n=1 Tax=Kocuria kalidii TaxID=3376283 RepID=UPI00379D7AB0
MPQNKTRSSEESPNSKNRSSLSKAVKWVAVGLGGALVGAIGSDIYGYLARVSSQPVDIVVEADPSIFEAGEPKWTPFYYFVPVLAENMTAPPEDCRARREWAYDQRGADADESRVLITMIGNRDEEISVQNARVEIIDRTPTGAGVVAACPVGGATGEVRGVVADLGSNGSPPRLEFKEKGQVVSLERLTLDKGETETFYVIGRTSADEYVEWRIVFDIVADGDTESITVDDDGSPFRTAGTSDLPMYEWSGREWKDMN